jgi:hypothetical protein
MIALSPKQQQAVAALREQVKAVELRLSLYVQAITDAHDVADGTQVSLSADGAALVWQDAPPVLEVADGGA